MGTQLHRAVAGLLAALGAAAILALMLPGGERSAAASMALTFAYGLPFAAAAVAATEFLRLRHPLAHAAFGVTAAVFAAYARALEEPISSQAFANGAQTAFVLLAIGLVGASVHWSVAGRSAGWQGVDAEIALDRSAEAFARASTHAYVERRPAVAAAVALGGLLVFVLLGSALIKATDLRGRLIAEAAAEGRSALVERGHAWATFNVEADRGIVSGVAPDAQRRRAAFDDVNSALASTIGVPGVLAALDNDVIVAAPMAPPDGASTAPADSTRPADDAADAVSLFQQEGRPQEQSSVVRPPVGTVAREGPAAPVAAAPEPWAASVDVAKADMDAPPALADSQPATAVEEPETYSASCSAQERAIIKSSVILFDMQWFDIAPSYAGELDRLAAAAAACAPRALRVTGHSDADGDSLFNETLGMQRALAVRRELVDRGVDPQLIVMKSTHEAFAASRGQSAEERALNRRTDFNLLDPAMISRDSTQSPDERATNCENDLSEIMSQSIILFRTASTRISEESSPLIARLASAIQTCGSVVVDVEGHTDKIGADVDNQALSEARAATVRDALITAGADPTRLISRGFAASRPHDPAETATAFAMNRRIEFKVSGKFTSTNSGGP